MSDIKPEIGNIGKLIFMETAKFESHDKGAFIFILCCNSSYGPTFGGGFDFCISNSTYFDNGSYSYFGDSYDYSGGNPKDI